MCEGMGGGPAAASGDAGEAFAGEQDGHAQQNGADGGLDFSAVIDQLNSMASGQEEMRQALEGLAPQQVQQLADLPEGDHPFHEGEGEGEGDPGFDASGLDDAGFDPGDPEAEAHQQAQAIGQFVNDQVQQAVAPIQQQVDQRLQRADAEGQWRDVLQAFPELGHDETWDQVQELGRNILAAHGADQQLMQQPWFVGVIYQAGRAMEMHQAEMAQAGEPPGAARLEGGGGAAGPGGGGQSIGQLLQGQPSVLPFP